MAEACAAAFRPLCVFPVYNHAATLAALVEEALRHLPDVLVVDDGSADAEIAGMLAGTAAVVVRHGVNRGKGAALRTALTYARGHGFSHMVAIDADGQHAPADLPRLLDAAAANPLALVVGVRDMGAPNVPRSSRFGRAFSNFWVMAETGVACADTQCGYRVYPVALVSQLPCSARRYNFEIEIMVRAFWAGLPLAEVAVATHYPPQAERITHFHKWRDNFWLTHTHILLVLRRLWPWPARRLLPRPRRAGWRLLLRPGELLRMLLRENATPAGLAASAAVGTVLAVLPMPGLHSLAIFYVTTRFNLNRLLALTIQNLFIPPLTPGLCIWLGHILRHGALIPRFPRNSAELLGCFAEWVVGALVLAPLFGMISGVVVYRLARFYQGRPERRRDGARRETAQA